MFSTFRTVAAAALFAIPALGALTACDKIDEAANCVTVCNRYADCFDGNSDRDACIDECRQKSEADADFSRDVDTCNACIDDRACSEAVFPCAGDCGGVIIETQD